jgi:hypothetical protein
MWVEFKDSEPTRQRFSFGNRDEEYKFVLAPPSLGRVFKIKK